MTAITPEIVAEHGLSPQEYDRILHALGREPNLTELGIFSVMWSEHCSYKSSRIHLKKLPTTAPWVICGPGENAGVIDIGDGDAAIFKMESHNHPSYIEPYQGAATGVGGILRDVFTMGARPVANMNALRFGDPSHPEDAHLIAGVSRDRRLRQLRRRAHGRRRDQLRPAYNGNILVNAMTVGVAKTDKIFYSAAAGHREPGRLCRQQDRPRRHPRRDHGVGRLRRGLGGEAPHRPGRRSLHREAADRGLSRVDGLRRDRRHPGYGCGGPHLLQRRDGEQGRRRYPPRHGRRPLPRDGMTPYEMMLSESQERMLMVLKPGREAEAEAIYHKWELDFAVIGTVTDTGRMELVWKGETVADIPLGPLADEAPLYDRPALSQDEYKAWAQVTPLGEVPQSTDIAGDLLKLMASPALASRRWIWEQYDQQVGGDTVQRPGGDAAVVRVHGSNKALAITTDCTPRYCFADPYEGGKQAIAEAYRNLSAVGATPLAVTNCLNFANPQRPEIMARSSAASKA
jgi:phosphoribosylformylglycinamidine synthase